MANKITYKVNYQIDKTSLHEIRNSLQSLSSLTVPDAMNLNKALGTTEAFTQVRALHQIIRDIDNALERSFNADLGVLNVTRFRQELGSARSNIVEIQNAFSVAGAAGNAAFRSIATSLLTTNTRLKETHNLLDSMAITMRNTVKWWVSSSVMNSFTGSVQQAYGYVKNLDRSLNDIRIVTNKSAEDMTEFAKQANKAAQSLSASTTDYTNASLIYYQQGLSDEEVAKRTEVTLKAANVTQQRTDEVSEQLTAVWNGYKVSAQEAELYVDKLAAVAATTASNLEELSTGMSRVASAANLMGVDVDQLNAQLSTIISVTRQAPESVGTALRSIYARMSDIEAGLDEETTLGSYTEKMNKYGINVLDVNKNLRNMGEVIEEVGEKWSTMSRESQVALAQAMAGTRQYNNLLALFDNWNKYADAIETSRNAMGTLQKQQDIYSESTKAHLMELRTASEDLYDSLLDSSTINAFAKNMTNVTKTVTLFVDSIGGGGNALLTLGSIATNVFSKQIAQGITTMISNFDIARERVEAIRNQLEAVNFFRGTQDPIVQQTLGMVERMSPFYNQMSNAEFNSTQDLIKQIANVETLRLSFEESDEAVLRLARDITGINNLQLNEITRNVGENTENWHRVQESIQNVRNTLRHARVDQADFLNDWNQVLEARRQGTLQVENFEQVYNRLRPIVQEVDQLINRGLFSENLRDVQRFRTDIEQLGLSAGNSARNMRDALEQSVLNTDGTTRSFTQTLNDLIGRLNQLGRIGNIEIEKIRTRMRQSREESEALIATLPDLMRQFEILSRKQQVQGTVQALIQGAAAIGQLASALSSLRNLKNIWNNENLSDIDKILQTVTALSFAISMLVGSVTSLIRVWPTMVAVLGTLVASPIFPLLVAIGTAIATVALVIKKVKDEMNASAKAIEKAANQVEILTKRYDECKQSVEEFKDSVSDYKNAIESLKELEKSTDEYSDSLEEANEKARELIKTYKLFDSYEMTPEGLINIDPEVLEEEERKRENQSNKIYSNLQASRANLENISIFEDFKNISKEIGTVSISGTRKSDYLTAQELKDLAEVIKSAIEANNGIEPDIDTLKEAVKMSDEVSQTVKNHINTIFYDSQVKDRLIELSQSSDEAAKSNQYYSKQILGIKVEEQYQDIFDKIKEEDETLFDLLVSATTSRMAKEEEIIINSLNAVDVSEISSREKLREYGDGRYSDISSNQDLAFKYAKEILGIENAKYSDNTITDLDTGSTYEGLDEKTMSQALAFLYEQEKILGEVIDNFDSDKYQEALKQLVDGADKLGNQFGVNLVNSIVAALANGDFSSFDFSSIFEGLNKKDIQYLTSLNGNELMAALGIESTQLRQLGYESADQFYKAWLEGMSQYDDSAFIKRIKESEEKARNLISGIQSGDIDYKNIAEEEDYNDLIKSLENLKSKYPEITIAAEELSKTWNVGTQRYIEALEMVQDKMSSITIDSLIEDADDAEDALSEFFETDENGVLISINADGEGFEEAMNEYLNAQYAIDIEVHTQAEQEFDSIMNAMDDITEKASMIGEKFVVSAEDIRELNNTFPGIIQGLEDVGDGTVRLNQEIVESAINAAEAEVAADMQATVQKLEFQAEVLRGKEATYRTMAEAAAKLARSEVLSEDEAADQKAIISSGIAKIKGYNSKLSTDLELDNNALVANESREAGEVIANNFKEAYNLALKASAEFARGAITNMQSAMIGDGPIIDPESSFGDVQYKGSTYQSAEAKSLQNTQDALTKAKTGDEIWAQLAAQYESLANSAGAAANDLEGMIAQIGASGINLDKTFKNIKSGKGAKDSSKSAKDPDLLDYLEDEADRYHDINLELEDLETHLNRLDKQQKKLYGKDLINNLNEQLDILEKQKDAYGAKLKIANAEAEELRNILSMQGVSFDSDGYISNYASAMQSKLGYVNDLIAKYNAMSAEEQEGFKDTVEAAKKDYENFTSQIDRYDELISSFIPDIEDEIQDAIDKQIELQIQKFTMEVEIRLDMAEAERDFNEFKRKVIDEIKDDDILGVAKSQLKDYISYFNTFDTGIGPIQKLTDQVNDTMDQIKDIDSKGWAEIYGDNKAQAIEDLTKYYEELMGQLEDVVVLVDEIRESYLDMIDKAIDAFDKQVDQYEYINDLLNHDMNVIGLLYGDDAYEEMSKYYQQIESNNNKELDFLKKRVSYAEQMMNAETDPKAKEKWQEEWMNALEELNKKVEDSLENIIDKYVNAINQVFDALNKKVTDGLGLDYVEEEWNLVNKNADQYLDTINSLYAIQDLENKYLDALDATDSISAQKKLNDLMNEQLGMLRDKDKLTQYDVDRANMLYEIALKEIALQEAQQNKSKMRLRRDSQGNYTYQYVSDEDSIAQAQQDLLAAQNDLYNFDKDRYRENLNEIYSIYNEFQEKLLELYQDQTLTAEERQKKEALLVEQYGELINGLVEQNEDIRTNLHESAFLALANMYNVDVDNFNNMSEAEQDILMNSLIPQWDSGIQHMADKFAGEGGFIPTCKEAFEQLKETTNDYQISLDELEQAAGVDFDSMAEGYDRNIQLAQELLYANDELINKYMDEIDAILAVISQLDNLIYQYKAAQAAAEAATSAAYAFIQAQRAAAAVTDYHSPSGGSYDSGYSSSSNKFNSVYNGSNGSGDGSGSSSGKGSSSSQIGSANSNNHGYVIKSALNEAVLESKDGYRDYSSARVAGLYRVQKLKEGSMMSRMPYLASSYDTGGYTGDWGNNGKVAILHEKELVLNKSDTENILNAVDIVRDISSMVNNLNNNLNSRLSGLISGFNIPMSGVSAFSDTLEQNVHIDANFPNVNSANNIEEALKNLVNVASMHAFKANR